MGATVEKTYAFVSHESAVDAIWWIAEHRWEGLLDDEGVWLVPDPKSCVKSQGDLKRLSRDVDLTSLGITHEPLDLLVPNKSCYSRGRRVTFHVWADFFPPRSFLRVHDRVLVSTPYFIVLQLAAAKRASRLTREKAEATAEEDARVRRELGIDGQASSVADLLRWENIARFVRAAQVYCDFAGTYRFEPEGGDVTFDCKSLVTQASFEAYLDEVGSSKGIERARSVAKTAFVGSASPMETTVSLILTLPVEMGGFGLPRPVLNHEILVDEPLCSLASQQCMIADLCWPEKMVLLEYCGWREHFGKGPKKVGEDAARANSLTTLGWTVLQTTYEQVKTMEGISLLARQIACALGVTLEDPTDLQRVWRTRLLALLLPKTMREW